MATSGGLLAFSALYLLCFLLPTFAHWSEHHRYSDLRATERSARIKRQFGDPPTHIDLNITVPFIFSARLYPYGSERGDATLNPNSKSQAIVLRHEMTFFGRNYSVLHILKDGAIGFSSSIENADIKPNFQHGQKVIAAYWAKASLGNTGKVYFRETEDKNVLSLAKSEVQIQYRYGDDFQPKSVLIVTWENVAPEGAPGNLPNNKRNLFQIAIILSNNGSFAHLVYSKMRWNANAVAGFNEGPEGGHAYFALPGSGTPEAILLANKSDIGIPGEWIFKLDMPMIHLCGPGYKGLECINKCDPMEWSYDCVRRCNCMDGAPCNDVTGACANGLCNGGWANAPVCDVDIDECTEGVRCPTAQPDCINTPGAYICMCLSGYDNETGVCRGSELLARGSSEADDRRLIEVVPVAPRVVTPRLIVPPRNRPATRPTTPFVQPAIGFTAQVATARNTNAPPPPPAPVTAAPVAPRVDPPLETSRRFTQNPRIVTVIPGNRGGGPPPRVRTRGPVIVPLQTPPPLFVQTPQTNIFGPPQTIAPVFITPPPIFIQPETQPPPPPPPVPVVIATQAPRLPQLPPIFGGRPATRRPIPAVCDLQCGNNAHCAIRDAGRPACVCDNGWSGDGLFCVDVNECFLENSCQGNALCQNTLGSYSCLCDEGYQSDGQECIDIDECDDPLFRCPGGNTSECINKRGSFDCRCKEGFNGNPSSILGCIDINECLIPEFYCGDAASCENTLGGFTCECHDGYTKNRDGNACDDVDECLQQPCSKAAVCNNVPGSFYCQCVEGYVGNGFSCQETNLFPFDRAADQRLPNQKNSVVEMALLTPVKVFGQEYSRVYVSSNGFVSFDQPLREYIDMPFNEMHMVGFSPLYIETDLGRGGNVFVKETTDAPYFAAEYSTLTRSSLNIEEDFNEPDFRAKSVLIVTFDGVYESDLTKTRPNSFQMVLASGEGGTFVTYIYDEVASTEARAAIVSQTGSTDMPSEAIHLTDSSNVAKPGRWMFRADEPLLIPCPSGRRGPPFCVDGCEPGSWGRDCSKPCRCAGGIPCDFQSGFCSNRQCQTGFQGDDCQHDVNECMIETHLCDENAHCTNTDGSYYCECGEGFTGDGFACIAIDYCYAAFGVPCSGHGICLLDINSVPHCLCNQGFIGDGFHCQLVEPSVPHPLPTDLPFPIDIQPVTPTVGQPTLPSTTTTTTSTTSTTTTTTAPQPIVVFTQPPTRPPVDNRVTVGQPEPEPEPARTPPPPPNNNQQEIDINSIHDETNAVLLGSRGTVRQFEDADTTNMLVIIIPAVLCGVWLILVVVLLAVCIRRRKARQASKFGMNVYSPPPPTSRSAGVASVGASYGSGWTIPRPGYDYYQTGQYYPSPYAPYK